MAEHQLSVRSARARDLAHELARREKRSVAQIVERALTLYRDRTVEKEPMDQFLARLRQNAVDVDLEALIKEGRAGSRPEIEL